MPGDCHRELSIGLTAGRAVTSSLTEQVEQCDRVPKPAECVTVVTRHEPQLPITAALWLSTGPEQAAAARGGWSVSSRVDDRIAYLTLTLDYSNPLETVAAESLLTQARRLV